MPDTELGACTITTLQGGDQGAWLESGSLASNPSGTTTQHTELSDAKLNQNQNSNLLDSNAHVLFNNVNLLILLHLTGSSFKISIFLSLVLQHFIMKIFKQPSWKKLTPTMQSLPLTCYCGHFVTYHQAPHFSILVMFWCISNIYFSFYLWCISKYITDIFPNTSAYILTRVYYLFTTHFLLGK